MALPTVMGRDQLPPKDNLLLQEDYRIGDELRQARATIENYDRQLRRRTNELLRQVNQHIDDLQHESQRSKDFISDLQNLINVHQKLDPKTLSDASGPQVFSTKADDRIRDENRQFRSSIESYDRELRRRGGEMQKANHFVNHLQHELQQSKDNINGLQNELINIHQQLEDAKALSEVRGKELHGAQVFLTKADTLPISEVGEKVTALNKEIFQAAATLGEALIHRRHEVSPTDLEAASAVAQEMVGEKMTNILIGQAQKPEPEVNPRLVQVVLQIFMVEFCVSKVQSWYPSDEAIGDFLSAIYSEIRSTGKASH